MVHLLLALTLLILFSASAYGLSHSVMTKVDFFSVNEYSVRALKIERFYKIFAWGALTFFLFFSFAFSMVQALLAPY